MDRATTVVANKGVLSTNIRDETAILDMASGKYYGLNEVGKRIWELVQAPQSIGQLIAIIMDDFDVDEATCEADITTLLTELQAAGLVEVTDA